jgi:hypothetical protein
MLKTSQTLSCDYGSYRHHLAPRSRHFMSDSLPKAENPGG